MLLTKSLLKTTDKYIEALKKGGIETVEDLINHFPRDYEDRTNVLKNFTEINLKEKNTLMVKLISIDNTRTSSGKILTKSIIEDTNGLLAEAVWFNRKFLATQLKSFEGKELLISGKVKYDYGKLSFQSPDVETDLSKVKGEILPIYPEVNYIPSKWLSSKISLLKGYISLHENPPSPLYQGGTEILPPEIIKKYGFISRKEAIYKLHFPKNQKDIDEARYRLAYEELFEVNYRMIAKKHEIQDATEGRSVKIPLNPELIKDIISTLPYELTNSQKIVLFQVLKDMEKTHGMERLLEGDVGTGKTIVAIIASLHAILQCRDTINRIFTEKPFIKGEQRESIQVAFMAPTEILARQHFQGVQELLIKYGISSELLVGSTTAKQKERIKGLISSGNLDIIFGTHALIQEDVIFKRLGLVIIDEQHRFGVKQREALEKYTKFLPSSSSPFSFEGEGEKISRSEAKSPGYIFKLAKDFRKSLTSTEDIIWEILRNRNYLGIKFRRQHPIGRYIADFYSEEKSLVIEIDGKIHEDKKEYDRIRDDELSKRGLSIYRIKSQDIENDLGKVLCDLENTINSLSPKKERGLGSEGYSIIPHSLNMTATPIPRSLALTLYGDQDLSVLNEYPKGRKNIITKVIKNDLERSNVELFVRSELEKGRQVFWISPLVEESEKIDLANAINTYESLIDIFTPYQIGLLHGKMPSNKKELIMKQFSNNEIQVLSSTSVVEVGVDIPNATVMCIEGAERFGLSQLHQFRGRVGRGDYQSYCYLFPSKGNYTDRLRAMERTNNGFELAEIDLNLRGPGEVYGVKQSGIPEFKIADLKDLALISQIREDIEMMFKK